MIPTVYNSTYTGTYNLCTRDQPCFCIFEGDEIAWYLSNDGTVECPGSGVITHIRNSDSTCIRFAHQQTVPNSMGYFDFKIECSVKMCA